MAQQIIDPAPRAEGTESAVVIAFTGRTPRKSVSPAAQPDTLAKVCNMTIMAIIALPFALAVGALARRFAGF